jgi:CHASE2 domain-containing sensor protein
MPFIFIGKLKDLVAKKSFLYRNSLIFALALLVIVIVLCLYQFNILERLELLTLDYRFILIWPKTA